MTNNGMRGENGVARLSIKPFRLRIFGNMVVPTVRFRLSMHGLISINTC